MSSTNLDRARAFLLAAAAVSGIMALTARPATAAATGDAPCTGRRTSVLVHVKPRLLFLCRNGRSEATYRVSLGRGGTPKTTDEDKKTPVGQYPLENGRDSYEGFYRFLKVGYPTPEQIRNGYTGGAIGIHGPDERLPPIAQRVWGGIRRNWTRGCIAVNRASEIYQIEKWVRQAGARSIEIIDRQRR